MKVVSRQGWTKITERDCETCRADFHGLLENKKWVVCYRPISDLRACAVFGNLGSVLGPTDSSKRGFDRQVEIAVRLGETRAFAKCYFESVLASFVDSDSGSKLLLPVPSVLIEYHGEDLARVVEKALRKSELASERLVLIHPGIMTMGLEYSRNSVEFALAIHRLGIAIGAGRFDCALSEELIWSKVDPPLMLLDEGQFYGVSATHDDLDRLTAGIEAEVAKGRHVMAQGISNQAQLMTAMQAGVNLAWGEYIGHISQRPSAMMAPSAHSVIRDRNDHSQADPDRSQHLLSRLWVGLEPITPEHKSEDVFNLFEISPQLRAVAVVDQDGAPMGLISRYEMVDNMARPYRHELFGRKSCIRFMDPDALCMDVGTDLADMAERIINALPHQLISGFIVTNNGRYLGVGSVQDLMREITSLQIKAARHANPLTQLPGNVPIQRQIDHLLSVRQPFTIAYCDLDNFKPFNDIFGYAMGDQMIGFTANVLADCHDSEFDFLGHVGGDDFILVFRSQDWERRCQAALDRFEREVRGFFSQDTLDQGGYQSENRKGEQEFHPILSLSIGAVEVQPGMFENHLAIAVVATEAKKKAKSFKGNRLYVNKRDYSPGTVD